MAYWAKNRIYYTDPKGNRKIAPADTVILDMDDETAERHIEAGHLREATKGEIAEFAPAAVQADKKPRAKKAKDGEADADDLA